MSIELIPNETCYDRPENGQLFWETAEPFLQQLYEEKSTILSILPLDIINFLKPYLHTENNKNGYPFYDGKAHGTYFCQVNFHKMGKIVENDPTFDELQTHYIYQEQRHGILRKEYHWDNEWNLHSYYKASPLHFVLQLKFIHSTKLWKEITYNNFFTVIFKNVYNEILHNEFPMHLQYIKDEEKLILGKKTNPNFSFKVSSFGFGSHLPDFWQNE